MMKFLSMRALRLKFPRTESIVQVRVITKMGSTLDVEGPVSQVQAQVILRLAIGQDCGTEALSDETLTKLLERSDVELLAKKVKKRRTS
jgi:hypothetical protein